MILTSKLVSAGQSFEHLYSVALGALHSIFVITNVHSSAAPPPLQFHFEHYIFFVRKNVTKISLPSCIYMYDVN